MATGRSCIRGYGSIFLVQVQEELFKRRVVQIRLGVGAISAASSVASCAYKHVWQPAKEFTFCFSRSESLNPESIPDMQAAAQRNERAELQGYSRWK